MTYRLMTRICREAGLIKQALHVYRGMRRYVSAFHSAEFIVNLSASAAEPERVLFAENVPSSVMHGLEQA